ncbi:MAG: glycosyltransferase family 39 protein [Candidatus Yanofskybacteria bacterium]|nr:glycosyltransferase family 39 protein [Candidatus Yanofskybacteria bacterium]
MTQYTKIFVAAAVLLSAVFLIPFFSAQNFSPSSDEIAHLPSGYSYWKTGDVVLNPQHPPLVKLLASFPLLFLNLKFDKNDSNLAGPSVNEWQFGKNFLFGNDTDKLLLLGRIVPILISVLLGFYIFKWASEMFSRKAGTTSLFIYAFMPNIIAHAQFVTTDVAVAAFSFITLYYLWKLFKTGSKKFIIHVGISLGLALGSKFSGVLLIPIVAFLLFVYARKNAGDYFFKTRRFFIYSILIGAIGFLVIWIIYLFPTGLDFYLKGFRSVYSDISANYYYYLNGNFSRDGWWYYFIFAFFVKTPIPALIAFALSLAFYKKYKLTLLEKQIIFIPVVVFLLATIWKAGNIGVRYILPIYPFLILYAGGLALPLEVSLATLSRVRRTLAGLLLTGLAGWYIFSAVRIYPDYLAYFNEFVGGSANGYKYLDDSNIEWGQDLKRLGAYQIRHPETKILYSWRKSDPGYYGIENDLFSEGIKKRWLSEPSGRYAVNTHFLVRLKLEGSMTPDKYLNWLDLYKPVDRIGYSFLVYEF